MKNKILSAEAVQLEIININKYIKIIENKNIIMIYHNNKLNAVIKKDLGAVYTTAQNIKKSSIKNYIDTIPAAQDVEIIYNINNINIDITEAQK